MQGESNGPFDVTDSIGGGFSESTKRWHDGPVRYITVR